jgi:hypothetical protein
MRPADRTVVIDVQGPGVLALKSNDAAILGQSATMHAAGDQVTTAHIFIAAPPGARGRQVTFTLRDPHTRELVTKHSAFLGLEK